MSEWNTYIQSGMSFHWSTSFPEFVVSYATVISRYLRSAQAGDEAQVHEAKVHWQWALNGSISKQQTLCQNLLNTTLSYIFENLAALRHITAMSLLISMYVVSTGGLSSGICKFVWEGERRNDRDRSCLVSIDGCSLEMKKKKKKGKISVICMVYSCSMYEWINIYMYENLLCAGFFLARPNHSAHSTFRPKEHFIPQGLGI